MASGDDIGMPDRSKKAQHSAPLKIASIIKTNCSKPPAGSTARGQLTGFTTGTLFDAKAVVRRGLWRYRPQGSRTPRGIGLDCVEKRDRRFGVGQGSNGNPRRHKRARRPELVVGGVAQPA